MPVSRLSLTLFLFLATLLLAWIVHGTGVVKNDLERNIYIPDQLTMTLQVKAAYNAEEIFFRYRWPAQQPSIYHDMLVYRGGQWQRIGKSPVGHQPQGIYEDRVTMLVDDGSVPEFDKYGGYVTVGNNMRFFTNEASKEAVQAHPYLGQKKGKHEVRKFLPETRTDPADWAAVVSEPELAALRDAGYFLDFWHWRAHRSNPLNQSDDQFVAEYRYGDEGQGVYTTNWDAEKSQPKWMFDPDKAGIYALNWSDLAERKLGFDDVYYLHEGTAIAFDPNRAWQEGDTLPRRLLRPGSGSHADIRVSGQGRWQDGYWDVTLQRALDTGHPLDDKAFEHKRKYWVGFAVHRDASGGRWHYVSLPVTVGLERDARLRAVRFDDAQPQWQQDWFEITLFYPGQVGWPLLNSEAHAGAGHIAKGVPVRARHIPEQLAHYGVEMEFTGAIIQHWLWSLIAGVLLIVGFGVALMHLLRARPGR
ncbi:MAG: ethylbenzene dehydrogenase-related protein [Pseudohongiellaceae bacterium]